MSGGHFDYNQYRLNDIAEEINRIIEDNDNKDCDEWGDCIGRAYPKEIIDLFKEASHTLKRAEDMAQRVDWLICGDDSQESFIRRWREEVRTPWDKHDLYLT